MKRLTGQTIVAVFLAGLVWLVGPGPWFAPGGATGQEPAKAGTRGQAVPPSTRAQPPGQPDDDDEASFREAMAHKSLQENCLICHTEDMIAGQRLTQVQWKAEIVKMVNWGSPLPKEAADPLIDYLVAPLFGPIGTAGSHACRARRMWIRWRCPSPTGNRSRPAVI